MPPKRAPEAEDGEETEFEALMHTLRERDEEQRVERAARDEALAIRFQELEARLDRQREASPHPSRAESPTSAVVLLAGAVPLRPEATPPLSPTITAIDAMIRPLLVAILLARHSD